MRYAQRHHSARLAGASCWTSFALDAAPSCCPGGKKPHLCNIRALSFASLWFYSMLQRRARHCKARPRLASLALRIAHRQTQHVYSQALCAWQVVMVSARFASPRIATPSGTCAAHSQPRVCTASAVISLLALFVLHRCNAQSLPIHFSESVPKKAFFARFFSRKCKRIQVTQFFSLSLRVFIKSSCLNSQPNSPVSMRVSQTPQADCATPRALFDRAPMRCCCASAAHAAHRYQPTKPPATDALGCF